MAKKKINKAYRDSDADGLTDELEKKLGTNPERADSDKDGVGDYEEVNIYGTDPLDPDTDKDGVKDGEEIKRGRNPRGAGWLKDLFVPHAGNDYQPKALHPYRLLFYALSSILLKVILIGAVIVMPIEAWLTPDILADQSRKIIELTNAVRKSLNLPELTPSSLLNQAAGGKAQDMLLNQYFSHTGPDGKTLSAWLKGAHYDFAVAGENLAMGFTSPEQVVSAWSRSRSHYLNMVDKDFRAIGVAAVAGQFGRANTTLVAQYLAAPKTESAPPAEARPSPPLAPPASLNQPAPAALGEKITAEPNQITVPAGLAADITPPQIDLARSKLYLDQPRGQNQKVVRAEVYLSSDAVSARVNFDNYYLELKPPAEASGPWTGQAVIFSQDEEQIFNPVVLASVTAEDASGNKRTSDLDWSRVAPAATGALEQYNFIKSHTPSFLKPLFDVTSTVYKIILGLAIFALALNVLIKIKKQHPHLILSALGLIIMLIILLVI